MTNNIKLTNSLLSSSLTSLYEKIDAIASQNDFDNKINVLVSKIKQNIKKPIPSIDSSIKELSTSFLSYKSNILNKVDETFIYLDNNINYSNNVSFIELIPSFNSLSTAVKNYIKASQENYSELTRINREYEEFIEQSKETMMSIINIVKDKPILTKSQSITSIVSSYISKANKESTNEIPLTINKMEKEIVELYDKTKDFFISMKSSLSKTESSEEGYNLSERTRDDAQNAIYQTEIEILKENIGKKEKEILQLKQSNTLLSNENKAYKANISEMKKEKEKIIFNSKNLSTSIKELLKESTNYKNEILDLRNKINSSKRNQKELKTQNEQLVKENASIQNELIEKTCKMSHYKIEYEKLQAEQASNKTSNENKVRASRNSILDILQVGSSENKSVEKKDEFEKEREQYNTLQKKMEELKKEINVLKKENEDKSKPEEVIKANEKKIEEMKNFLLKSTKELIGLKKKIFEKDKKNPTVNKPQTQVEAKPQEGASNDNEKIQNEIKALNKTIEEKVEMISKLTQEKNELKIEIKTLTEKGEKINNENIKVALLLSQKDEKINLMQTDFDNELLKMKNLIQQKENLLSNSVSKDKINELNKDIADKDSIIEKLTITIQNNQNDNIKLKAEIENKDNEIKEQKHNLEAINELTNKNKELSLLIIDKDNKIKEKEEQFNKLSLNVNTLYKSFDIINTDSNSKETIHIKSIEDIHSLLELLQNSNSRQHTEIQVLKQQIESLSNQKPIEVHSFNTAHIKPQISEILLQFLPSSNNVINPSQFTTFSSIQNPQQSNSELTVLQDRIKQLESNYTAAKELISSLKSNNTETSKLLTENINKNKELQSKLDSMISSFNENDRQSYTKLQSSVMSLIQSIAPHLISIDFTSESSISIDKYIDLIVQFGEECNKKDSKVKKYKDALVKMKKMLSDKKKEISNLLSIQNDLIEKQIKRENDFDDYKTKMQSLLQSVSTDKGKKSTNAQYDNLLKSFMQEEEKYKKEMEALKQENEKMKKAIANNSMMSNDSALNISTSSNQDNNTNILSKLNSRSSSDKEHIETEKLMQEQMNLLKEELRKTENELDNTKKANINSLNIIKSSFGKIINDITLNNDNRQFLAMIMKGLGYTDNEVKDTLKKKRNK